MFIIILQIKLSSIKIYNNYYYVEKNSSCRVNQQLGNYYTDKR